MSKLLNSYIINIKRYLFVGFGGGLGALSRYLLTEFTQNTTSDFPYSTLIINLIGAFLLTFMLNLAVINFKLNDDMKLAINVGLIGSFTTFSLIMIDLIHLIKTSILLVIYYLITILCGLFIIYILFNYDFRWAVYELYSLFICALLK